TTLQVVGQTGKLLTDNLAGVTLRVLATNAYSTAFFATAAGVANYGTIRLESAATSGGDYGSYLKVAGTLTNAPGGLIDAVLGNGYGRGIDGSLTNRGSITAASGVTLNV